MSASSVMVQGIDEKHVLSARCDFCGTEHKFEISSRLDAEQKIEITINSVHGAITFYAPRPT